jgi:hypothetical protein
MSAAGLNSPVSEEMVKAIDALAKAGAVKGHLLLPLPKGGANNRQGGHNRGQGKAIRWLCAHVNHDGRKCLFWPFGKERGFPGCVGYLGKHYRSSRLMCALAHGAPPSDLHEAAYSCGRGNKGCINPKHLAWKTQSEHQLASVKLGRKLGFQGNLDFQKAAEIRAIGNSVRQIDIARQYGISGQRVSSLLRGNGFNKPVKPWIEKNGRFYTKIGFKRRSHWLGAYASPEESVAAYNLALERLRRGEPAIATKKEKLDPIAIAGFYSAPAILKFGEQQGEIVAPVNADQEESVFLLHHSLNDLHPKVRKFVIAASATGDLAEAALAAGLNQAQLAAVLPKLKVYLRQHLC